MTDTLESLINKIIQSPLFLRLKAVVENNGYHDHEDVYSHLLKTKDLAQKEIKADFITNPEAKKLFLEFIDEDFYGMKRAEIMLVIALLHDIGKILKVKEGDNLKSIVVTDADGITSIPGHEFWGSTIVSKFLVGINLPEEVLNYIATIIKLHATFDEVYFNIRKDWPMDRLLNDVKSKAENFYKEAMFNQYCDCFSAKPFEHGQEMLIKLFNEPTLYVKREYVI